MRNRLRAAALGLLILAGVSAGTSAQTTPAAPTLYKRLGGYDAIAAVTDEFVGRLSSDKVLSRFVVGMSDRSKAHLRQMVVDQLCAATGGPCVYLGQDMKTAHKGLGITNADWDLTVKHLTAILDKLQVPGKEKGELLAAVSAMKGDIVEKP